MQIEKATFADIQALSELLSVLFSQEEEFTPDAKAQSRGLAQIITNPEMGAILLARQDGQIVGMVNLLFTLSTALGDRVALLEDMVVSPLKRGNGIGSRLLAEAIAYARSHDCKRITLLTDQKNATAQSFYKKQGFMASNMLPMRLVIA